MTEERVQRRLAAILAADVVGYSRLMEADEAGTLDQLKALRRELFEPKIKQYGGRIFKTTGDGALVEFKSAVDAVHSAVEIQRVLAEHYEDIADDRRIRLRIGVSLGDVIVEGSDLYGNGVNVAARMEGLAEPGGICISGNVHEHVGTAAGLVFDDLGEQQVKNINRPVQAFRVGTGSAAETPGSDANQSMALLDRPSIAVLPFQNMSGDPEQEYFADGITEDLITSLSHIRQFFVIARNSVFTFKEKRVDVQRIARELGVRYVLEGSVRKTTDQIRISAQLIDGETGSHLWAQKYDRKLEDIFSIQDEITTTVVGAIAPQMEAAERERARRKPADSLTAWDMVQRGSYHLHRRTSADSIEAMTWFQRAATLSPDMSLAHAMLAEAYTLGTFLKTDMDAQTAAQLAMTSARAAVELDREDAAAYSALGRAAMGQGFLTGHYEESFSAYMSALEINPNSPSTRWGLGRVSTMLGYFDDAKVHFEYALKINPRDPLINRVYGGLAEAYFSVKEYDQCIYWMEKSRRIPPPPSWMMFSYFVGALALSGKITEARDIAAEISANSPEFSLSTIRTNYNTPFQDDIIDGLRKAGLPE